MEPRQTNDKTQPTPWSRNRVKRYLVQRFYTRFHMSLILSSSALTAMLINWGMLNLGVHAMWVRHPIAVACAYSTFLAGVWLWLKYVGVGERSSANSSVGDSLVDSTDALDMPFGGSIDNPSAIMNIGGGQSGGGGASASWNGADTVDAAGDNSSGVVGSLGGKLGGFADLDGDAIVLLLLALVLLASIFLLSGYVIWFAPDILGEAAFGAMLSGGLIKSAKRHDGEGWVEGVVKKTWWPFAIVFALSMALAIFASTQYPAAHTLGQAIHMALGEQGPG